MRPNGRKLWRGSVIGRPATLIGNQVRFTAGLAALRAGLRPPPSPFVPSRTLLPRLARLTVAGVAMVATSAGLVVVTVILVGRAGEAARTSVGWGKGVAVRVGFGGARIIKTKTSEQPN